MGGEQNEGWMVDRWTSVDRWSLEGRKSKINGGVAAQMLEEWVSEVWVKQSKVWQMRKMKFRDESQEGHTHEVF